MKTSEAVIAGIEGPVKLNQPKGHTGVGMVEVLVTLLILSVGLLGVASLQFVGSFSNSDALNRSQAVMVLQQMSERLRASSVISSTGNGRVVDNSYFDPALYNFNNLSCGSNLNVWKCHCLAFPAGIPNCQTGECTAANFASYDAYEMSCSATSSNPAMEISVTCSDNDITDIDACSAGSLHRVRLAWPVEDWHSISRQLNPDCNDSGVTESMDCVIVDLTL